MSFEIKKVYTDSPYVDEMVYYSKQMGIDTVLKLQSVADRYETVESLKAAGLYISCVENTATLAIFPKITVSALNAAGIIDPATVELCLLSRERIPEDRRKAVVDALRQEYIENYVELNQYYRALNGLPPIGQEDYVTTWIPPEDVEIDLSKPIHEMSRSEASILDRHGVLDDMMKEDPVGRMYMRHLGKRKIDIYHARRAQRFDPLYVPQIDSDAIYHMFKDKLDANKFYVLRTVYSEAYNYNSDYYDNFIAVFIVLITIIDIISRVQEFIARKEIFDIRSVQYLFQSYGVPFFEEIPLKYQIAMVKNLHTLLKYKSTAKCMVEICSLFGFDNIKIFKYYLLRDRRINLADMSYVTAEDEDGNEDLSEEYELKFLKVPLGEDLDDYIRVAGNYVDYDEITYGDPKWDGGLDHNMVMEDILKEEFNFTRTKYISIDTVYEIAKMAAQQAYFFNFLYDNVDLESMLTIQVPYIEPGKEFKVADLFTLLTVLSYRYRNVKDTIMDTSSKVLYVNGFNFKADLAALAEYIGPKKINDVVVDPGSTLHAQEQLKKFQIPTSSIPSFNEMMDIYVNNMEVRDELIKGMCEADNKRVYDVYAALYDALMIVELNMDYYKNPETGEFYKDEAGHPTYSEFLKHQDPSLYYVIEMMEDYEDDLSRNQYISNLIDSITYALEEFIDTDEFQALFAGLPVMSSEAVKIYISTVINFYKSYKVDFLGLNTIYIFDDKDEGYIRIIDDMLLYRYFDKEDCLNIIDKIGKSYSTMTFSEKVELIERLYMDIKTWSILNPDDHINIRDEIYEILTRLALYTIVKIVEEIYKVDVDIIYEDMLHVADYVSTISVTLHKNESLGITERIYIYNEGETDGSPASEFGGYGVNEDNYMSYVAAGNEGAVLLANDDGDSAVGPVIVNEITVESGNIVTEKAVADYVESNTVSTDNIATSETMKTNTIAASNSRITSEKAVVEALTFNTL